ncbi:MAG: hypothetical protein JWO98_5327 [Frankiales bacterium]|nr:hypothetical protein [Frankiales bacterium]
MSDEDNKDDVEIENPNSTVDGADTVPEEIAGKTADSDENALEDFVKTFVLGGVSKLDDYDHEPNKIGVRNEAVQRGLRPTGDVSEPTVKKIKASGRTPASVEVTYSVPVEPAHLATESTFVSPHSEEKAEEAVEDDKTEDDE